MWGNWLFHEFHHHKNQDNGVVMGHLRPAVTLKQQCRSGLFLLLKLPLHLQGSVKKPFWQCFGMLGQLFPHICVNYVQAG